MLMWNDGRAAVEKMIDDGQLERISASRDQAEQLVAESKVRLASARLVLESGDNSTAGIIAYDSARLALSAILANEGLRTTTAGGHYALFEAVSAQLGGSTLGATLNPFNRMRRQRNDAEYRSVETPALTEADVLTDIQNADRMIDVAERIIPEMPKF